MNNKLIIENHKFYFHPTYIAYAGSLDGYAVHAINRIPTLGIINDKGYYSINLLLKMTGGGVYMSMISFISVFMAY